MGESPKRTSHDAADRIASRWPERGLLLLLIVTPFAFGGAEGWGRALMQILAGLVLGAWGIARWAGWLPLARDVRPAGILWGVGLVAALAWFQTMPIPPGWIASISPGADRLYAEAVPGYASGEPVSPSEIPRRLLGDAASEHAGASGEAEILQPRVPAVLDAPFAAKRSLSLDAAATRRSLILLICLAGLFFFIVRQADGPAIARIVRVGSITAIAVTLFGLIQMMTWNGRIYWVREGAYQEVFGPFVNRNAYVAFVLPFLTILVAKAHAARGRGGRGGMALVGAALIVSGIVASLSRAGMLLAVFTLALLFAILSWHDRRPRDLAVAMLLPLAGGALIMWRGADAVAARIGTMAQGLEVPSIAQRLEVWQRAFRMLGDHPIAGTGLGTFGVGFLRYAPSDSRWWLTAHNDYLQLAAETGIIGALLALGVLLTWARGACSPIPFRGHADRFLHAGILSGLAGVLLHAAMNADLAVPAVALVATVLAAALLGLSADRTGAAATTVRRIAPADRPGARIGAAALAALLIANTWDGVTRFRFDILRLGAAQAMRRGDLVAASARIDEAITRRAGAEAFLTRARVIRRAIGFGIPMTRHDGMDPVVQLAEGLGAAARTIDLSPALAPAWMEVAQLYQAYGDAQARRAAMIAAGLGEDPAPRRGIDAADRVALAAARRASALHPEDAAAHDFMARLLRDRGEIARAADHLGRSFALMPALSAHEWIRVEPPEPALMGAILEGIEQARPGATRPMALIAKSRAEALALAGRHEDAIAAWESYIAHVGAVAAGEAQLEIGKHLQALGRHQESLEVLDLAAGGTSRWAADAFYFLGKAQGSIGDHDAAVASFRTFLDRSPDRPLGHLALARGLINAGRPEEAVDLLERAEEIFPENTSLFEMLEEARQRAERGEEESP